MKTRKVLTQLLADKKRDLSGVVDWLKKRKLYRDGSPTVLKLTDEVAALEEVISSLPTA